MTPGAPERFLDGGGEMGARIRNFEWAPHALGHPSSWQQSLRTTLRLLLNSRHPMYLWWGPELFCFCNDAFRRSFEPERHLDCLGRPGREVWAEAWEIIGPPIEKIMKGDVATWDGYAPGPITRNRRREDADWTCNYSPIDDGTAPDGIGGVLLICAETTPAVLAERQRSDRMHQTLALRRDRHAGRLPSSRQRSSHRRRILVVDDNRDLADMLGLLLELEGHETRIAYGGAEAIGIADHFEPEFLVLDIAMPDLNGYDTARELRKRAWARHARFIAATGWGQAEDRRRSLEAGFDHHLLKPVDPQDLRAVLEGAPPSNSSL